jgi:dienelactone hydrolase
MQYKKNFDLKAWLQRHSEAVTRPRLDAVIAALKEKGITQFGATGYCFGGKCTSRAFIFFSYIKLSLVTFFIGKYVFNLAQENVIKVGAVAHPSLLQIPGDLEILQQKSKTPMLINSCDNDPQFSQEACGIADKIFGDGNYLPGYSRLHWPGCNHGFAVRGPFSVSE